MMMMMMNPEWACGGLKVMEGCQRDRAVMTESRTHLISMMVIRRKEAEVKVARWIMEGTDMKQTEREAMRCLEGTSSNKEKTLVDPSSKESVAVRSL